MIQRQSITEQVSETFKDKKQELASGTDIPHTQVWKGVQRRQERGLGKMAVDVKIFLGGVLKLSDI